MSIEKKSSYKIYFRDVSNKLFSLRNIFVLASSTVNQIIRMKVLYFLLLFGAFLLIATKIIPSTSNFESILMLKKISFAIMDISAWVFAIITTATLIPKDVEDKTLYTIISKSVRKGEYLLGKLVGILFVIMILIIAMFLMSSIAIYAHQLLYISEFNVNSSNKESVNNLSYQVSLINKNGWRPELIIASFISFLKSSVVASMTLVFSTFSSSSIFIILVSLIVFFIGHVHVLTNNFWLHENKSYDLISILLKLENIIIPNLQIFSLSEGIVRGEKLSHELLFNVSILGLGYIFVFFLISLFLFWTNEF